MLDHCIDINIGPWSFYPHGTNRKLKATGIHRGKNTWFRYTELRTLQYITRADCRYLDRSWCQEISLIIVSIRLITLTCHRNLKQCKYCVLKCNTCKEEKGNCIKRTKLWKSASADASWKWCPFLGSLYYIQTNTNYLSLGFLLTMKC